MPHGSYIAVRYRISRSGFPDERVYRTPDAPG
jgi:hypothetical protein